MNNIGIYIKALAEINKFDEITDENKKSNIIKLMKNLVEYRLKIISK
ncbi:hypothetical protein [Clostridium saccharoperbutylacetonicum]